MPVRTRYDVTAERNGRSWSVAIPDVRQIACVRRLEDAERVTRDVIAAALDVPADSFDVNVVPRLDDDLRKVVGRAHAAKARATLSQAIASATLRLAASRLTAAGLSSRDAGFVLGVSHQRVGQLLATSSDGSPLPARIEPAVSTDAVAMKRSAVPRGAREGVGRPSHQATG